MTMRADCFVDTNVLLAATAVARAGHAAALSFLEAGFAERSLFLSGQVLREYIAVATRPAAANGLGLCAVDAIENARQFLDRSNFLPEDEAVRDALLHLFETTPCAGKQVHDANIAATMVAHGIGVLVTLNPRDFERFASRIRIVGPDEKAPSKP
ncbi:MAG: type II toxin-antitoxin system VapC family toxin [Deltaproteobacteria bacterium]|nr:type II toxin-antitoxin system VapC family toxin [Deltaproteobacteria bacterium]